MWDKICQECGVKFQSRAKNTIFCPDCAKRRAEASTKKYIRRECLSRKPSDDLIEAICSAYRSAGAIGPVASAFAISHQTARRILINAGLYTSPTSKKIRSMYEEGKTVDEISAELQKSRAFIIAYLPYEKGLYIGENKTKNAIYIKKSRTKQKD